MICRPIDIPPDVASRFVDAMRTCFAEKYPTKRDTVAARQLKVLQEFQGPREKKLRLSYVKGYFFRNENGRPTWRGFVSPSIRLRLR